MSVIKGICSAIKEDKVNEWLKDNDRKVELSGGKWSDEEFELFERERCKAVRESVNSCEYVFGSFPISKDLGNEFAEAAAKVYPAQQKLMNTSMSDISKTKQTNIKMAIRTEWLVHSLSILSLIIAAFLIFGDGL